VSADRTLDAVFYGLILLLPLSALFSRRISLAKLAGGLATWTLIFGLGFLIVQNRHRLPNIERLFDDQQVVGSETRIPMSPDGHFWATVELNGKPHRMLIDSGATTTAISTDTARAAGIDTGSSPFPAVIRTANGTVTALTGTADTVHLGSIRTRELGVVVSSAFGDVNVIGMNFLSRLHSWRVENQTLILTPATPQTPT